MFVLRLGLLLPLFVFLHLLHLKTFSLFVHCLQRQFNLLKIKTNAASSHSPVNYHTIKIVQYPPMSKTRMLTYAEIRNQLSRRE